MGDFLMPSLGADMDAGTLVAWKKSIGEAVKRGEILAEVETDKGVIAVESFEDGVLERTLVEVGTKVPVGTKLAVLREAGRPLAPAAMPAPIPAPAPPAPALAPAAPEPRPVEATHEGATLRAPSSGAHDHPILTISARSLARELHLDPERITGSGPHGVVTRADVRAASGEPARRKITPYARRRAEELGVALDSVVTGEATDVIVAADVERVASKLPSPPAPAPASTRTTGDPLTPEQRMRRAIGAAMARSKREIPHYYLATTIDLGPALARLALHNQGASVSARVLPAVLLLKAAAFGLKKVPELNARCTGDEAPPIPRIDLGVAIALRKGGLLAPPIVDAAAKSLPAMMTALDDLVGRARSGRLTATELAGGTITVTSLGDRGVESLYPIIYPPQVAIVGFGKIVERPWVVDGAVVPRPVVTVTLGADHRFSDGHRGALYLAAIEAALASPDALFADDVAPEGPAHDP